MEWRRVWLGGVAQEFVSGSASILKIPLLSF